MKVLLFANDLLPFGSLPTSGGGLRCYQLMKGLQAHGVEVTVSMPGFTYLAEKHKSAIPEPEREHLWRWGTQDAILRRVKPDVVLFASNWDHFNLSSAVGVPVVIDLHGSRLVETRMWGDPVDANHKVRVLSRADCLLCAGRRQRSYFYGWLLQANRVPEGEHFIRYVPVSQDPALPEHAYPDTADRDAPVLVSGGGWFPWQDQSQAIFAACRELLARDRGSILLYGTPHETPHTSPEERAIRQVYREVQAIAARSRRVRIGGYVGRQELLRVYRGASVALEAMRRNFERELAFTTRTIEYLWCGLPVLYNDYAEIAEHIRDYDAGWTVDPASDAAIAAALEEIFEDPAAVRRKGGNAQRLVRDRFTWDKTILPLLEFVQAPRKAARVKPVLASVAVTPSYLEPAGERLELKLAVSVPVRQRFVVPADGIRAIELPFSPRVGSDQRPLGTLRLDLRTAGGRLRARRTYRDPAFREPHALRLPLRWYRPIRGGETLVLDVLLRPADGDSPASAAGPRLAALRRAVYPLLDAAENADGTALALRFVPGRNRLQRVRTLATRAYKLVRSGHGKLLVRAAARRVPGVARQLERLFGRAD